MMPAFKLFGKALNKVNFPVDASPRYKSLPVPRMRPSWVERMLNDEEEHDTIEIP